MSKVVKIKVQDESGQALAGKTVQVTGCGELESNGEGLTQFLVGSEPSVTIEIAGAPAWTGKVADLGAQEVFQQTAAGFARL